MGNTAYRQGQRASSPVDVHVGARVRLRRTLLAMTQTDLGNALGLTFQQVQRYERGTNRISASKLFGLSRALGVPVSFFFEDLPATASAGSPAKRRRTTKAQEQHEPDLMTSRETLELVRAYYKIEDPSVRRQVYELTKAVGTAGG